VPMNPGPDCEVWAPFSALASRGKDGTMSKKPTGPEPSAEALLQATFARNLRAARKRRRMTQADVAERVGVSTPIYWRYEKARMWPSIETLRMIVAVLDVSADNLFGIGQEETPVILPLPSDDSPMVRRILGQLRRAHASTRRIVEMVLAAIEKRRGGQP
jgi:transcriptional regulator with XRE-family HTH domain